MPREQNLNFVAHPAVEDELVLHKFLMARWTSYCARIRNTRKQGNVARAINRLDATASLYWTRLFRSGVLPKDGSNVNWRYRYALIFVAYLRCHPSPHLPALSATLDSSTTEGRFRKIVLDVCNWPDSFAADLFEFHRLQGDVAALTLNQKIAGWLRRGGAEEFIRTSFLENGTKPIADEIAWHAKEALKLPKAPASAMIDEVRKKLAKEHRIKMAVFEALTRDFLKGVPAFERERASWPKPPVGLRQGVK